jgi:hypothetical protein
MQAFMIFLAMGASSLFTLASTHPTKGTIGLTFLLFMVMFTFGVAVGAAGRGR